MPTPTFMIFANEFSVEELGELSKFSHLHDLLVVRLASIFSSAPLLGGSGENFRLFTCITSLDEPESIRGDYDSI